MKPQARSAALLPPAKPRFSVLGMSFTWGNCRLTIVALPSPEALSTTQTSAASSGERARLAYTARRQAASSSRTL